MLLLHNILKHCHIDTSGIKFVRFSLHPFIATRHEVSEKHTETVKYIKVIDYVKSTKSRPTEQLQNINRKALIIPEV